MIHESGTTFRVLDKRFSASADETRTRPIPTGFRPHSLLLGYFSEDEARQFLRDRAAHADSINDLMQAWQRARSHIGELDPLGPGIATMPVSSPEVVAAITQIMSEPRIKSIFPEGTWSLELAEISKLIPASPDIDLWHTESSGDIDLDPSNPVSAIPLCFAHRYAPPFSVSLDQAQKSVSVSGIHPAFEVVGLQCGQPEPDVLVVSFMVTGPPNLVTALRHQGRLFLSNGYHRVYRLMTAGFSHVPCIVRETPGFAQIAPKGSFFGETILTAPRPPLFTDFADPILGVIAPLRAMRRVIRIRPDEYLVAS